MESPVPVSALTPLPGPVALVHEWFSPRSRGGSELVVEQMDETLMAAGQRPDLFALVAGVSPHLTLGWRDGPSKPVLSSICPGGPAMSSNTYRCCR